MLPTELHAQHWPACAVARAQAGWGKQLTYCVGVWRHGAADVSRRYSKDWAATAARRRLVREGAQRRCLPAQMRGRGAAVGAGGSLVLLLTTWVPAALAFLQTGSSRT